MRIKLFILTFLFLFFRAGSALAGDPPALINPPNNSTVSSSKLQWQTPSYPICSSYDAYRVQVDDNSAFPSSSVYRDTYTSNTYYTPQLTLGTWYWRVMARDETCKKWSSWSNTWSFILTSSTPASTPVPTPTFKPSPSAVSTPNPSFAAATSVSPQPVENPVMASNQPASSGRPAQKEFDSPSFAFARRRIASSAYHIASVAGIKTSAATATPEAEVNAKNQRQANFILQAGITFVLIGISVVGYIYLKRK